MITLIMKAPRDEEEGLQVTCLQEALNEVNFFLTSSGYTEPLESDWSVTKDPHTGATIRTLVHNCPEVSVRIIENNYKN